MRKKLILTALTLICLIGLTACGAKTPTRLQSVESKMLILQNADFFYNRISDPEMASPESREQISNFTDDESVMIGQTYLQKTGLYLDGKTIAKAVDSYNGSVADIGNPRRAIGEDGMPVVNIEQKADEVIVNMPLEGDVHNGSVEMIIDRNFHVTSITTNVDLTVRESLQKAGINTAIGMGTVFVMLIVISFIISAMSVIPKLMEPSEKKKSEETEKAVDKTIANIVEREESEESEETDDTELAAVIAAAVAAFEGSSSSDGFVVRSIRRIR